MANYCYGWVCFLFTALKMTFSYLMLLLFSSTFSWSLLIYFSFYFVAFLKIIMSLYSALMLHCVEVILCFRWDSVRTHCGLTEYWRFSEFCSSSPILPRVSATSNQTFGGEPSLLLGFPSSLKGAFFSGWVRRGRRVSPGRPGGGGMGWGESSGVGLLPTETLGHMVLSLRVEGPVVPWRCCAALRVLFQHSHLYAFEIHFKMSPLLLWG